ncbi:MAG TPA: DNA integrity scanning diadenylate cyclase DisA [Acidimicrobiales bacterium]|nr:DNA integrity scanning diadenylate cyclase DisA [Acidimicrobiales bacterium]
MVSRSPLDRAIAQVAPGQALRDGLDRVVRGGMGALIVIGDGPQVLNVCSGGFLLDAAFSPQRLFELAKMDGAVILAADASRIARANVHLVPDPSVPTTETGTRHRTAERVARSLGVPVLSVSERMASIAVYVGDQKHPLSSIPRLVNRADQAIEALERYKARLETVSASLAALEIEDLVTVRDVAGVLQRGEMVVRIAVEVERYLLELGTEGRMIRLQLEELMRGVEDERRLVLRDYQRRTDRGPEAALERMGACSTDDLLHLDLVAEAAVGDAPIDLESPLAPRGYRMLARIPRLPEQVVEHIVERFGSLDKILRATLDDLDDVEGVGATRAQAIKDGLSRLAASSILDRYT